MMRSVLLAVLATAIGMTAAPVATASNASVEGDVLLVTAAPGETNDVELSDSRAASAIGVRDDTAGVTAGPGCAPDPAVSDGSRVVCGADGVQRVVVRLGDGDDQVNDTTARRVQLHAFGEGGNDFIGIPGGPGSVADGGEGNDEVQGSAEEVRGGPGDDRLSGSRLLDGGEGNDVLTKSGTGNAKGRLTGGSGDDNLSAFDGFADQVQCGDGQDVLATADETDKTDGSCETVPAVEVEPEPLEPQLTVFELPGGRSRPGRDGRLRVWMKCSHPDCQIDVRIFSVGLEDGRRVVRFRKPPLRRVVVGQTAKLVRLPLTREQRRGLSRTQRYDSVGTVVITRRPGADYRLQTDGNSCIRAEPCR